MAKRVVSRTGKDSDGDITRLCGSWGATQKATAIREIEGRVHTYVVQAGGAEVVVRVKHGTTGKYLSTSPDGRSRNNLDDLPDC